jgi:hypothetical protein
VGAIPAELKGRPQWVVWRYELRGQDWTKVPYNPRRPRYKAKAGDPSTWGTFAEAWSAYCAGEFDGIGFEFSADDPYFGVDVDKCLQSGVLLSWAEDIVGKLATFGDISPSGRGIKFFAKGQLPEPTGTRRTGMGPDGTGALEVYDRGRFFTITGEPWGDVSAIGDLPDVAVELYRMAKTRPGKTADAPAATESPGRPSVEDRAIKYLATIEPAISGQGGHDKTFGAACRVGPGFDLPEAITLRLIRDHYNPRCEPPWSDAELEHKVRDAYRVETRRGWLLEDKPAQGGKYGVPPSANGDDRPAVEVNREWHVVVERTIEALGRDQDLFCRGGSLGTIIEEAGDVATLPGGVELAKAQGSSRFLPLSEACVGCHLTKSATFFEWRKDKNGEWEAHDVNPPGWLIKAIATRGHWPGIRPLLGIAGCPYVRPDGSIPRPGYDPSTGVLYRPSVKLPKLSDRLTQADAKEATARLNDLVIQFPFASGFDWNVWLAALLTAIQRPAIVGPVPGFVFNGNKAGCGKGLLIDVIGIAVYGCGIPSRTYPSEPGEAGKVKLALALAATPAVHFDNLPEGGFYGSSELDSAITSTVVSDRILGQSRDSGSVPLRPVWTLSGNNVSPSRDAFRRWLPCNLMTLLESPHERPDITIGNLRQHVAERRAALIGDALVILKAHALADRPTGGWAPLGSFEAWDRAVRGAVHFATGNDCLHTQRQGAAESPDRLDKLALLEGWSELPGGNGDGEGLTIEEAINTAMEKPELYPTLHAVLMRMKGSKEKTPSVKAIAYRIRGMRGQNVGGMKFDKAGENRAGAVVWKVFKVHA